MVFSFTLLIVAILGLGMESWRSAANQAWMPILLLILAAIILPGRVKNTSGQIYEKESAYNYIQVVEEKPGGMRYLLLNEGQGIHSVYKLGLEVTYGTWDYFLVAPFFNAPPVALDRVHRLGLVGLAAGTISKQFTQVFGPIPIDGWEIDPEIVTTGELFFSMNEPNLNVIVADGRWGLSRSPYQYSVIGVDAYRLPYIPWHLTTQEFFQEVYNHLEPQGVMVINVGRTPGDRRLIEAMVGTVGSVFPTVHVVDVPKTFNTILYGTVQPSEAENLVANYVYLEGEGAPLALLDSMQRAIDNIQPTPRSDTIFTDDWAPVETLTNAMAIQFILGSDLDVLR
jgi:spermidine synthase